MEQVNPLPFHTAIRDYLKSEESELWAWFSSKKGQTDYAENVRIEILKEAYRLDRATHEEAYTQADEVRRKLGLEAPVTLYQSQMNPNLNAALSYLPGEAHVIFSGPVLSTLSPVELGWVIGHELSHYCLFERDSGEFLVADLVLHAMASDRHAEASHVESFRLFRLYTEVFADRGGLSAVPDPMTGIGALIKLQTGLREVNALSYLAQAEEILAKGQSKAEELSHPEAYIRARALKLWADKTEGVDDKVAAMIEGVATLDGLDLLGQRRLTAMTRDVISRFFAPAGLRIDSLLAHAKLFFDDFQPPASVMPPVELNAFRDLHDSVRRYLCYVLLDLVAVDPELTESSLAAGIVLSRSLAIEEPFVEIAAKELKIKKRLLTELRASAEEKFAKLGAATP